MGDHLRLWSLSLARPWPVPSHKCALDLSPKLRNSLSTCPSLGEPVGTPETPLGCQIKNKPQRKKTQDGRLQHFSRQLHEGWWCRQLVGEAGDALRTSQAPPHSRCSRCSPGAEGEGKPGSAAPVVLVSTHSPTWSPRPGWGPAASPRPRTGFAIAPSPSPWQPRSAASSLGWALWSIPTARPGPTGTGIATGTRPPHPTHPLTLEIGQRHHLGGDGAGRGQPPFHVPPRQ